MQNQDTNLPELIPTRKPNKYRVRLNTPFRPLFIGLLDTNGEGRFTTQRTADKHVLRQTHGIAINAALLLNPEYKFKWVEVDFVHIDGAHQKLITSREYILEYGEPFCYREYEPQLALGLLEWGIEEVLRFEREKNAQNVLFGSEAS